MPSTRFRFSGHDVRRRQLVILLDELVQQHYSIDDGFIRSRLRSPEQFRDRSSPSLSSAAQSSSLGPRVIKVAFQGAGKMGQGNADFMLMARGYQAYSSIAGIAALRWVLAQIDRNGDHIVSTEEINAVTVRIAGYSRGGVTAVYLAKALSTPGIIRVDAQKPPTVYKLEGSVSVEKLILLDRIRPAKPARRKVGIAAALEA